MHDDPPMSLPLLTRARAALESTPTKAAQLLHAITMSFTIRTLLARHGYSPDDHREGLELLRECVGPDDVEWPEKFELAVQDAVVELDAWDEKGFRIVEASLRHRFPDQARFVLAGLGPTDGPGAVQGVRHLLDRLDALEASEDRKASRREDRAALDALAKRGITTEERKRLRALVEAAEPASESVGSRSGPHPTDHETRLLALRAWYEEWASIARAAVTREDQLTRMGLASFQQRAEE
ncbi:MAG: hypothetical protein JNL21_36340 [Myxococcales bacterium]|nr:hypothetical protein [Myxococcales bacterium]